MVTDQTNARAVRWCTPAGGCRVLRVLWSNAVRWLRFTTRPEACPLLRGPLHELTLQPDASCPLKTMRPRPLASIPCSVCDNASQHTTSRLPPPRRLTFSSLTTTRFLLLFSSPTCMESSRAETQQAFSRRTRRRKPRRFRTNQPPHSRSQYPVLSFFFLCTIFQPTDIHSFHSAVAASTIDNQQAPHSQLQGNQPGKQANKQAAERQSVRCVSDSRIQLFPDSNERFCFFFSPSFLGLSRFQPFLSPCSSVCASCLLATYPVT